MKTHLQTLFHIEYLRSVNRPNIIRFKIILGLNIQFFATLEKLSVGPQRPPVKIGLIPQDLLSLVYLYSQF